MNLTPRTRSVGAISVGFFAAFLLTGTMSAAKAQQPDGITLTCLFHGHNVTIYKFEQRAPAYNDTSNFIPYRHPFWKFDGIDTERFEKVFRFTFNVYASDRAIYVHSIPERLVEKDLRDAIRARQRRSIVWERGELDLVFATTWGNFDVSTPDEPWEQDPVFKMVVNRESLKAELTYQLRGTRSMNPDPFDWSYGMTSRATGPRSTAPRGKVGGACSITSFKPEPTANLKF